MQVATAAGTWEVAPEQAVWVPPGIEHQVGHRSGVAIRTQYIDAGVARTLPHACCVVAVPPLLRPPILRAMTMGLDNRPDEPQPRMLTVILDTLLAIPMTQLRKEELHV